MDAENGPQYIYVGDVRHEVDDDNKVIAGTATPYCENCQHYHTDEDGCRCPDCGQREPCGVPGHG